MAQITAVAWVWALAWELPPAACVAKKKKMVYKHRELSPIFCDNLYGKRVWKGADVCICITESLCCRAVNQLYINKTLKMKNERNI